MKLSATAVLALLAVASAPAQTPAGPAAPAAAAATIVFHFERPSGPVPVYTFTIHEDGSGTYSATHTPRPAEPGSTANGTEPNTESNAEFTLSPAAAAKLFQDVRSTDHFRARCESKAKNVANTGAKTIEYSGPDGRAACTFNYTDNKAVEDLSETFAGMENMLEFGRNLDYLHRYDRLGLDAEMTKLVAAIKDRSAVEVETIVPVLRSIAEDNQVIERVRVQAGKLLQAATH